MSSVSRQAAPSGLPDVVIRPVAGGEGDEASSRARLRRLGARLRPLIPPAVLLLMWELLSRTGVLDPRFFSYPSRIAAEFVRMVGTDVLWNHVRVSLVRIGVGFALGAVPALALGLLMGASRVVRLTMQPIIDALYPIPKLAILPLLILIFGLGEGSKYTLIAIGVFFPVVINTIVGVTSIDRIHLEVARNFGASRRQFYRTVAIPGAMPLMLAGLRLGVGYAILLIVAAEFVGAQSGLGYMIWNSWQIFRIEDLFIGLFLISILGVCSGKGLDLLQRWLVPWKPVT